MYKLLSDKNNEFQCEIKLVGASEKTAKVRLFLEGTGCEYSFNGTIDGTRCRVNLGKLKNFSNLMESGKIRLEVIADDTLFVPYESTYALEESKSVKVEVIENTPTSKRTMVEVKVDNVSQSPTAKPSPKKEAVNELRTYFRKYTSFNGTLKDFQRLMKNEIHKNFFNAVCENYKLDKLSAIKQIIK
ncbi:hypothetical protein UFOVP449_195 [uncultured Caudovirales phage]|uniref:Uncharacterized protein n=1 Tax=uncultured Caudovirales phage TaxID=2100421 RepID=A0A6J5M8U7_9CAUD|nr:hypothetical protein UFOVP449_195 [uncultured Caudovirales phage]